MKGCAPKIVLNPRVRQFGNDLLYKAAHFVVKAFFRIWLNSQFTENLSEATCARYFTLMFYLKVEQLQVFFVLVKRPQMFNKFFYIVHQL